jgi:hypothetical protein
MIKYSYAIYIDEIGQEKRLYPNDLYDIFKRAFARSVELWDPTKQFRLYPRFRVDCPHFFALGNNSAPRSPPVEIDPAHNKRVAKLHEILSSGISFKIGYYKFMGKQKEFITLINTENYSWGMEITRTLNEGVQCRHDIFGAQKYHVLTDCLPMVGAEVIKDHFPDQKTFSGFISLTKRLPYLILFDFVNLQNYFLEVDKDFGNIRVVYYIYGGIVWQNGKPLKFWTTAAIFKEKILNHIKRVLAKD